ncbi:MAG: PhzF family phenazine biosynthesis protein [Gammaproteobacteria bacterium]|jgi:trans-2,3-dihydro-3-hydroxyanthranilate isomerase
MKRTIEFFIVDVFAETARAGNQLAVIKDAATLTTATMQSIAREFDFSETTFVCARGDGRARVRIFTPGEELPFAGHPTLGTAWILTGGDGAITLDLDAGDVPVEFDAGIGWMVPPPAHFGDAIPLTAAAAAVSLSPEQLDASLPPKYVRCGPEFKLIAVRDMNALQQARMTMPAIASVDGAVFAYCRGGHGEDADFAARMFFFDGHFVREDPATGSANSAFAAYLRSLGHSGRIIVEQGFEMGRPARIYAEIGTELRIGGRVQPFARGELNYPD